MSLQQILEQHKKRWDSEVMSIPYAKRQYLAQLKELLQAFHDEETLYWKEYNAGTYADPAFETLERLKRLIDSL